MPVLGCFIPTKKGLEPKTQDQHIPPKRTSDVRCLCPAPIPPLRSLPSLRCVCQVMERPVLPRYISEGKAGLSVSDGRPESPRHCDSRNHGFLDLSREEGLFWCFHKETIAKQKKTLPSHSVFHSVFVESGAWDLDVAFHTLRHTRSSRSWAR